MIARHILFFLLLLLLPDMYLYRHSVRNAKKRRWTKRLLLTIPTLFLLIYTGFLFFQPHFQPDNPYILEVYLWLIGLVAVPKAVYVLCSAIGHMLRRPCRLRRNYGNLIGIILAALSIYITVHGFTRGIRQMEVQHVDLSFADLPEAFDGYRIALFSDLHLGCYTGNREQILVDALDTVQKQHADLIIFAGDLQNLRPQEIYPHRYRLASLRARDGVVSVMGNHDYAEYIKADNAIARANEQEIMRLQRQMGWQLLINERLTLHRGDNDSIIIVGLDDEGIKSDCQRADIPKALQGVKGQPFTIIVEHEPDAWRNLILPQSKAQLTLSGHTHGGQITLFGFTPLKWFKNELRGLFNEGDRYLYVTSGIGGLIPLRYEVSPEVVVITLHKK